MKGLSEPACRQGELWGRAARDWAAFQEPGFVSLWGAALDAARGQVGTMLLDAGCGAGGASVLAAQRGATVYGIDPAVNLITIAHERLPRGDFRVAELEDLPFPNATFDAVIAVNTLQYVQNQQIAMHELGRVCKTGGRVVVAVLSDPEACDGYHLFTAIRDLFEKRPSGLGPFALSASGALESLIRSVAVLDLEPVQEVVAANDYPSLDAAVRGNMSAGPTWRAVEIVGEERVRKAIRATLERFQQPDGTFRMVNRYRLALAVRIAL